MGEAGEAQGKGKGKPVENLVLCGVQWPSHVENEEQLKAFRALPGRPNDVWVATYPKCGTHWVHKLCTLILSSDSFMMPAEFNRWDQGPVWPGKGAGKGDLAHADMADPRVLATHVPLDFLPEDAMKLKNRIVYVVREPKDALISYYHFSVTNPWIPTPSSLDEFAESFLAGATLDRAAATAAGASLGGYAAHVTDYVKAARAGANIHLMSYDRLTAHPNEEIAKLAKFLGVDLSAEAVEDVRQKGSFDSMKAAAKAKEEAGVGLVADGKGWSDILFRKGQTGDGSRTLSEELVRRADAAFGEAFAPVAEAFAV